MSQFVFCLILFFFCCVNWSLYHYVDTSFFPCQKHHSGTHFQFMFSSRHLPCLPQSGNAAPSLPIKLQSTNEDGVRHRITSNILSHTQACLCQPQISLQIKALKMGEELPDNNQITSCLRLDVSFQLGSIFLPSLDVQGEFSWVFPGWALTIHFNLHSKESWLLRQVDENSSHRSLFQFDLCLIMKMLHRQLKHS